MLRPGDIVRARGKEGVVRDNPFIVGGAERVLVYFERDGDGHAYEQFWDVDKLTPPTTECAR